MDHSNADKSRYRVIEEWLEQLCETSQVGDLLPTEYEVAERFDVSRMTARKAFQGLAQRGFIERRRGAGSFVAPRTMHRQENELLSFTEEMRRRGRQVSSKLLFAGLIVSPRDAVVLDLPATDPLLQIQRVRYADGIPLAIETVVLPSEFSPLLHIDLETRSLHAALVELGRRPARMSGCVSSRLATARELEQLALDGPTSLLVEWRVVLDDAGRKLEITDTAYRGDQWVIDTSAVVPSAEGTERPRATVPTESEL